MSGQPSTSSSSTNQLKIVNLYRDARVIRRNEKKATRHAVRPSDLSKCIFCQNDESPKKIRGFKHGDPLIKCKKCAHMMHLSCYHFSNSTPQFPAQYLTQEYNYKAPMCPDHFCEVCMTDKLMQSAGREEEEMVRCVDEIRAFHKNCRPINFDSSPIENQNEENRRILKVFKYDQDYEGGRIPVCCECGKTSNELDEEATQKKLLKCRTCVNMFHGTCHKTSNFTTTRQKSRCKFCIHQTQLRGNSNVLIVKNGLFRAAKIVGKSGRANEVLIQFLTNPNEELSVPINSLARLSPSIADQMFETLRIMCMAKGCSEHDCSNLHIEFEAIRDHLKGLMNFAPDITKRPTPKFRQVHISHSSMDKLIEGSRLPRKKRCHKNIDVQYSDEKGFHVIVSKSIRKGVTVGPYIGQVISKDEELRREKLATESNDRECKCYTFASDLISTDYHKVPIRVDAADHQNEMSLINHSCKPNCKAERVGYELSNGTTLNVIYVKTSRVIEEGEELTLNYGWTKTGFMCWCGMTKECEANIEKRQAVFKFDSACKQENRNTVRPQPPGNVIPNVLQSQKRKGSNQTYPENTNKRKRQAIKSSTGKRELENGEEGASEN
uniref:SET domain-containing protein n=1 Tax=Caenorhabditis tropicalis TaxID=1561998 RepID=A0A1I7TLU3_9PELO